MAIKYAIIGTNWITDTWVTAAQKAGSWQLHSVYSRTRETAEKFGSKYGCTRYFTSLEELGADKELQVVYIASPNNLHYAHAKQMIEAGKHIILEKPATSTVAELDDLFRLAQEKGVLLIEAYRHLQEANFQVLEKFLQEKKLGEIYGASITYASYSSRYNNVLAGERPNIFTLDFSGGSLVDIGVYPVTFAVALFGEPVSQTYAPFVCKTGVDGGGVIILRYNGFGVQINNSKVYTSTAPTEIYGEKGTIVIDTTAGINSMVFHHAVDKTKQELATTSKTENMMEEEAKAFAQIIEQNDKTAVSRLEKISKSVIKVTTGLRYENGLHYPADKQ